MLRLSLKKHNFYIISLACPLRHANFIISHPPTPRQQTVHLRQGAKRVFRRSTGCASVPSEGSNFHCDVGRLASAVKN